MYSKRDYRPENTGNPWINLAIAMVKNACDDWKLAYIYCVNNEVKVQDNKRLLEKLREIKRRLKVQSKAEKARIATQRQNPQYAANVDYGEYAELGEAARTIDERYKEICKVEVEKHKRTVKLVSMCEVAISKAMVIDRAYEKARCIMDECEAWLRDVGTGMLEYDFEGTMQRLTDEAEAELAKQ